jgi:hypothetical protein
MSPVVYEPSWLYVICFKFRKDRFRFFIAPDGWIYWFKIEIDEFFRSRSLKFRSVYEELPNVLSVKDLNIPQLYYMSKEYVIRCDEFFDLDIVGRWLKEKWFSKVFVTLYDDWLPLQVARHLLREIPLPNGDGHIETRIEISWDDSRKINFVTMPEFLNLHIKLIKLYCPSYFKKEPHSLQELCSVTLALNPPTIDHHPIGEILRRWLPPWRYRQIIAKSRSITADEVYNSFPILFYYLSPSIKTKNEIIEWIIDRIEGRNTNVSRENMFK